MVRATERWGAHPSEVDAPMPGDSLISAPQLDATRGIEIGAPPEVVFPWLVQMGPGRAGWYSYDWIDNAGRRSATDIRPAWQSVRVGDSLGSMGGIEFLVAERRDPDSFVIRLPETSRIAFTMGYRLRRSGSGTRLTVRVRAAGPRPLAPLIRWALGPGDFVMLHHQLVNVAHRATASSARSADAASDRL